MTLPFYFDFVSPYAFIAWTKVHAVALRHGREVQPIPVLFAGLLEHHGQKGPAEIPSKRLYTYKDAHRKAARAGIEGFRMPPAHPFNPLVALRVATLASEAIDPLFRAAWIEGTAIDTQEAVTLALGRAGLDGERLVREAQGQAIKDRLRAATAEAVTHGVFGVPTAFVPETGEIFWGSDSLELLDAHLRGEDVVRGDHGLDRVAVAADRRGHLAAAQQRKPVE